MAESCRASVSSTPVDLHSAQHAATHQSVTSPQLRVISESAVSQCRSSPPAQRKPVSTCPGLKTRLTQNASAASAASADRRLGSRRPREPFAQAPVRADGGLARALSHCRVPQRGPGGRGRRSRALTRRPASPRRGQAPPTACANCADEPTRAALVLCQSRAG